MSSVALESILRILLKRRNAKHAPRATVHATINRIRAQRAQGN